MFRRRRKLPEDAEPLVPHGLIWQATEGQGSTELPPDMWDSSPSAFKPTPAGPTEMPVRVSPPVESDLQPGPTAPDQAELSPPLKWPRVDDAEIARRSQLVDTAVSFPYRKPLVGAAVPKPEEPAYQEESEPVRLELVSVSPSTPRRRFMAGQFTDLVSRFRGLTLSNLFLILQRAGRTKAFSRLNDSAGRSVLAATQGLKLVRQRSGPALDAAKLRWAERAQLALSKSRTGIQRVRESIRAIDLSGPTRIWHRAQSLRVTIRIPASNGRFLSSISWAGTAAGTAKSWAGRGKLALQRDSRLWSSIAMGGVSALLALGVISALRHYGSGKELLPPAQETVHAAAPSPVTQAPLQPIVSREATAQKPSPAASASPLSSKVRKSTPASSSAATKHRVRHRSDEDDYVAADTYVYYGARGKPGR